MSRQGQRVRLAKGIYQDARGVAIVIRVDGMPREHREPLGLTLEEYQRVRGRLLARRRQTELRDEARRQTLAADISTYLDTLPKGRKREDTRRNLAAWSAFDEQPRSAITPQAIARQFATWQNAGAAPSTINHRRQALLSLYQSLDGRSAANPVRDVPRLQERIEEARGMDYALVERILAEVPERGRPTGEGKGTRPTLSQTRARLRVMAYTGLPQSQIGRLTPRDVDLVAATLYARPRRKGAGASGRTLPLVPQAVDAFKAFIAADAWGPFSARSMSHSFAIAVKKAKAKWIVDHPDQPWPAPPNVRSYDLRHSFGSAVYLATGDIRATAELMMHSSLEMTKRYTMSAVTARAQLAIAAFGATLVPRSDDTIGQNTAHSSRRATSKKPRRTAKSRAKHAK